MRYRVKSMSVRQSQDFKNVQNSKFKVNFGYVV